MNFIVATQSTWFLIGWIAKLLGYVMNWIFEFINLIGLPNIGVAIILFTIVVKALTIPMSIKQQKYSKLQSIMAPEIKAVTDKYKGKTDQASMMAQQEETKEIYAKYGTSATGGCLQLLIQMPVLFALYQVIYKLPGYITRVKDLFGGIADKVMEVPGWATNETVLGLAKSNTINKAAEVFSGSEAKNYLIDMMYNFDKTEWSQFNSALNHPAATTAYENAASRIQQYNTFLGMDLAMSPWTQMKAGVWWVVFIPILAGLFQFLSTKLSQTNMPEQKQDDSNPLASSMKSMNVMFPLMTVVFCFMFSAGLGVYWVASAAVQLVIQLIVNARMDKVDLNEMVKKNVEKANIKRIKRGQKPIKVQNVAITVKNLEEEKKAEEARKDVLKERASASTEYYEAHRTAKKGSLAEKAGMVQQYDERMKEIKSGKK